MKPELLLSLPPNMCNSLAACDPELAARCFATYDPPDSQLGSGGGTAYLLEQAWRAAGRECSFDDWLAERSKLLIHSGGESRRLPSYAASGKLFMPIPALRWKYGQGLDQNLLDMQEPFLEQVAQAAGQSRVIVASGDVLLEGRVESLPEADVVLLGMWTTPEDAAHFGVFFCDQQQPERLIKFLQKPSPDVTRELSRKHIFMVDVGVWVLSERAVACLMQKCGWQGDRATFEQCLPKTYDLYGEWALHLGSDPEVWDEAVSALSVAVVAVDEGEFYHFGRSSDIVDSSYRLQNKVMDQKRLGAVPSLGQPKQFVLNSAFYARRSEDNRSFWIENSYIPASWSLSCRNVITNVPQNEWSLELADERCLDLAPMGESGYVVRCYGYYDAFRGPIGAATTRWMGASVVVWLERRNLSLECAGLDGTVDLQEAALFPLMELEALDGPFIQWMLDAEPDECASFAERWLQAKRYSAREISQKAHLQRLVAQRRSFCQQALPVMIRHGANSLFYKLDISRSARDYARSSFALVPEEEISWRGDRMLPVHDQIFRAAVSRERGDDAAAAAYRAEAFHRLHQLLIEPVRQERALPELTVLEDQIVWARSPLRIDLAGGWSDTPPYCLEHGGSVFNVAVNLNGQPPIQVFVRPTRELVLTIRSIDLGLKEVLTTYEDIGAYAALGSGFSIARAAFALVGFHPDFNGGAFSSLESQLESFGCGVEVSLLAAVPKGSGLGTSSILAGTLLGGLADFCGLGWDCVEIARRVSALEQMLGSGGGWQDQYGGLLPGAKLIETAPGLSQSAVVRRAVSEFFDEAIRDGRLLLYYTGITRLAHDVLGEIVCNMFLNRADVLTALGAIAENGRRAMDMVQLGDWNGFVECVRRSWSLNQALDCGVNPPEVQALIERMAGCYSALKLAGAGGGGYMILVTESHAQSLELKQRLKENPPNERARFVELEVSRTGLQVSRS
jgi:galactokinase/mevalonate kinase-like predicted kinase